MSDEQKPPSKSLVPATPRALTGVQLSALRRVAYTPAAAGPGALVHTVAYAAKTSGLLRGGRALLRVNQPHGFDCPGCAWPEPRERSSFEFCENGAKAVAHEADPRRVDAAFFARHSIASLRAQSDHWLEQQGRLVEPMVRRPGADHYEPIGWDAAFALMGEALRGLPSPDDAAFYTSGRTSNEAAFLYQLFVRELGTNNLPDCSNLCHESSGKGLSTTIGVGKGTVQLEDFEKADCILVIGQNPGTNHPRMLSALEEAARRGCAILSVNPLRERALERFAHPQHVRGLLLGGSPITTQYLQVRINGDVALLKGIMKAVLDEEQRRPGQVLDRAFIDQETTGFDAFARALHDTPWELLVEESGVPLEEMKRAAATYVASERVIACWAMGITQHKNGVANVREIVNLLLMRGNLGREGAGVCPVRGHSNVQGDRTMGIYEAPSEAFLARLDAACGITAPRKKGHDVVATIHAMEQGQVQVLVAMGGNFLSATPDTPRTARALARCKLTAHVSTKLNRSHLEHGETALILPCLGRSERDVQRGASGNGEPQFVTVENSMSVVSRSEGRSSPASERLLSEPAIVARLAEATIGARSATPWAHLVDDYDRVRDLIERAIPGFERFNERVRAPAGFVLPNAARERAWATASGKAAFTVVDVPRHGLSGDQLLMMTIRSHDQFNTTIYGLDDRYRGIYGERRVVFLNAEDMAARGLVEGQIVDLKSHHQGVVREAPRFICVPIEIPRGGCATYFPEANPLVALESQADESGTPASKSVIVTLHPTASPA